MPTSSLDRSQQWNTASPLAGDHSITASIFTCKQLRFWIGPLTFSICTSEVPLLAPCLFPPPNHPLLTVMIFQLLPAFLLLSLASAAPSGQPVRVPAGTLNYGDLRKESSVSSNSPDGIFSSVSVVSLFQPLPKEVGNIVPACDYISHLRYKHTNGPSDSTKAVSDV